MTPENAANLLEETPLYRMWRDRLDEEERHEEFRHRLLEGISYSMGGPRPSYLGPKPPGLWERFLKWFQLPKKTND